MRGATIATYNWMCLALGMATGYWVIFATVASERFGTNLRGTVAITAPNSRARQHLPITMLFRALVAPVG
ncbi:MAG: hypothetical protein IPM46_01215 [Flavobacteriales bacterium]|nr:hypothetical protein [Flavobacteriales bacterium]